MAVVGILLAGGEGRRFGGDKLLQPLPEPGPGPGPVPLALASARNLLAALPQVIAVVRPGATRLASLLREAGCRVVVCRHASEGMGSTLASAVGRRSSRQRIRASAVIRSALPGVSGASCRACAVTRVRGRCCVSTPGCCSCCRCQTAECCAMSTPRPIWPAAAVIRACSRARDRIPKTCEKQDREVKPMGSKTDGN